MSYRPITDTWILARCKYKNGVKYYGGYPGGFLERARSLLGVSIGQPVLHVCSGMVRDYPYKGGFGPNDETLDLDPETEPDYIQDAREPFPLRVSDSGKLVLWPAILMDPPYTPPDADHYVPGRDVLPEPNLLLKNGLEAVRKGGRVGLLHYVLPSPPRNMDVKFVACISVYVGFNNRVRCYSVFERGFDSG